MKKLKKLQLDKETIANLNNNQQNSAYGGADADTYRIPCASNKDTCVSYACPATNLALPCATNNDYCSGTCPHLPDPINTFQDSHCISAIICPETTSLIIC